MGAEGAKLDSSSLGVWGREVVEDGTAFPRYAVVDVMAQNVDTIWKLLLSKKKIAAC